MVFVVLAVIYGESRSESKKWFREKLVLSFCHQMHASSSGETAKAALPPGGWRSKIHYKAFIDPDGWHQFISNFQLQSPQLEATVIRTLLHDAGESTLLATALPYEVELCR